MVRVMGGSIKNEGEYIQNKSRNLPWGYMGNNQFEPRFQSLCTGPVLLGRHSDRVVALLEMVSLRLLHRLEVEPDMLGTEQG
jgi:hypothetical protein